MYNFSSGVCLKNFVHSGKNEITSVKFIDEGQNKFIVAVGWDRKVLMWLEENTHDVPTMRELEGHAEDILCVAFCAPNMLATASYDGRILVWNLDSGYMKASLAAPELERIPADERAVEQMVFLKSRGANGVLVSAGADGVLRSWNLRDANQIVAEHGGHPKGEAIVALCADESDSFLFTGDAAGHVKVWDVSKLSGEAREAAAAAAAAASEGGTAREFVELYHWRAHESALVSLDFVDKNQMLLTGSVDGSICLWTLNGAFVGVFRPQSYWSLSDPSTWANPVPNLIPPPAAPTAHPDAAEAAAAAATTRSKSTRSVRLPSRGLEGAGGDSAEPWEDPSDSEEDEYAEPQLSARDLAQARGIGVAGAAARAQRAGRDREAISSSVTNIIRSRQANAVDRLLEKGISHRMKVFELNPIPSVPHAGGPSASTAGPAAGAAAADKGKKR
eukprot:tig00020909_g15325.t1